MTTMLLTETATTALTAGEQGHIPPPRRIADMIVEYTKQTPEGRTLLGGERRLEGVLRQLSTRMGTTTSTTVSFEAGVRDELLARVLTRTAGQE